MAWFVVSSAVFYIATYQSHFLSVRVITYKSLWHPLFIDDLFRVSNSIFIIIFHIFTEIQIAKGSQVFPKLMSVQRELPGRNWTFRNSGPIRSGILWDHKCMRRPLVYWPSNHCRNYDVMSSRNVSYSVHISEFNVLTFTRGFFTV